MSFFAIIRIPNKTYTRNITNDWYQETCKSIVEMHVEVIPYFYASITEYYDYIKILALIPKSCHTPRILILDAGLILKTSVEHENKYNNTMPDVPLCYFREIRYNTSFHRLICFQLDNNISLHGTIKPKIYPVRSTQKSYILYPYFTWVCTDAMLAVQNMEQQIIPKCNIERIHLSMISIWLNSHPIPTIDIETQSKKYISWKHFTNGYISKYSNNIREAMIKFNMSLTYDTRIDSLYMIASILYDNDSHDYGLKYFYQASRIAQFVRSVSIRHVYIPWKLIKSTLDQMFLLSLSITLNTTLKYDRNRQSPVISYMIDNTTLINMRDMSEHLLQHINIPCRRLFNLQYLYSATVNANKVSELIQGIVCSKLYNFKLYILMVSITQTHILFDKLAPDTYEVISNQALFLPDIICPDFPIDIIRGHTGWWLKFNNKLIRIIHLTSLSLYEKPYLEYDLSNDREWSVINDSIVHNRIPYHSLTFDSNDKLTTICPQYLNKLSSNHNKFIIPITSIHNTKILCKLTSNNISNMQIPYRTLSLGYKLSYPVNITLDNRICEIVSICSISKKLYLAIIRTTTSSMCIVTISTWD